MIDIWIFYVFENEIYKISGHRQLECDNFEFMSLNIK